MAPPSSFTVLCPAATSFRAPHLVLLFLVAALTRLQPTLSSSSVASPGDAFLRYSDEDPSRFHDDEYTATVFNDTSHALPYADGKAAVTGLLAALGNSMASSSTCRSIGAGTTAAAAASSLIYGLTRCAAGISCADCGRCLRGALAVVEREYNGSAGMQVLRLSCMARYETYPFYNATSLRLQEQEVHGSSGEIFGNVTIGGRANGRAFPPAAHPAPAPSRSYSDNGNVTINGHAFPPAAHPAPAPGRSRVLPGASLPPGHGQRWTRKRFIIMVIAPVATGAVIVAAITLLVWLRQKRSLGTRHVEDGMREENMYYQAQEHISTEEEDEEEEMSSQFYSYQVLEAATCHFSNSNKLGSGGFGTVYRGTLGNGKQVAVKRLKDSKRNLQELEREITIVANLRHKNLLRFLGYCFEEETRLFVYEYVPNNSLEKFWYRASFDQSQKVDWATWFNIIKGIARGLRYLHDQGIIHRDLKPHNVLLDENFSPKIADFDLMRVYDKEKTHESTEKVAGTYGYMAPECTSGRKFQLSIKSDVYSYGVLVLEIITGHKIHTFEGQNSESLVEYVWQHWTEKKASDVVDGDLGVEGQEHALRQALRCVHVALLCVQSDRSRRPTMGQAVAMLSSEEMELQEPSLPGYVVHPKAAASGVLRIPCLRCM